MGFMNFSIGEYSPIDFRGYEGSQLDFNPDSSPVITFFHLVPNIHLKELKYARECTMELALAEVESVLFLSYRFITIKSKGFSVRKEVKWDWQECPFFAGVYQDSDFDGIEAIANKNLHLICSYILIDTATNITKSLRTFTLPPQFVLNFVKMARANTHNRFTQSPILNRLYSRYSEGMITEKFKQTTVLGGLESTF